MRAPKEVRRWLNRMRRRFGKRNGVIYAGFLDNPIMERKLAKSAKQLARAAAIRKT